MGSDYLFSSRSSRIRISETAWSSVPNPSPEGRENQRYRGISECRHGVQALRKLNKRAKGMAVCHPLCHAVLGAYIPWICLISIVRRRSRRCCPCPFLPRPVPPSIRQIHADLPRFRSRRGYPAAEFGRCSRSHAAGCRCCW